MRIDYWFSIYVLLGLWRSCWWIGAQLYFLSYYYYCFLRFKCTHQWNLLLRFLSHADFEQINQPFFSFSVIFVKVCLKRILFVCLHCYYKNITTNYWGWVVLALVSVCTPHWWTSICAAFHSHIFVHNRIWFKTVFLCTSVLCGVFLLPQCLCIVYLCCSAYQNHLSFFTFRILQCCLLHDQCFPQLVSFPAFFQGEWKYC